MSISQRRKKDRDFTERDREREKDERIRDRDRERDREREKEQREKERERDQQQGNKDLLRDSVKVASRQKAREVPSDEVSKIMYERTLFYTANLIGQFVQVQVKDGSWYEGYFHTASHEKGFGVILKMARKKEESGGPDGKPLLLIPPIETLIVYPKDFVQMRAMNVATETAATKSGRTANREIRTDTDISGAHDRGERELKPFFMSDGDGPESGLGETFGNGGEPWDQFAENERLFGVTTTYKEDIYTTALDKESRTYREKIGEAAKLADEIEKDVGVKGSHRFLHLAEERGIDFETDLDEEARYSSVWRGNPSANSGSGAVSQAKYVPPAKRMATDKGPRDEDNGKGKGEAHDRARMKGSKDSIQQTHANSPKKKAQTETVLSPKQDRTEQDQPKKSPKEDKKDSKGSKAAVSPTTSATLSQTVAPSSSASNVTSTAPTSSSSTAASSSASSSSTTATTTAPSVSSSSATTASTPTTATTSAATSTSASASSSSSSSASSNSSASSTSAPSAETSTSSATPGSIKPAASPSGSAVKSAFKFNPNAKAFQPTAAPFVPSGGAAVPFPVRPAGLPADAGRKPGEITGAGNKRILPHEAETFLFGRSLEIHPRKISDMYCKRMGHQMQEAPESVSDTWPFGGVQYRYLYSNEEQMYYSVLHPVPAPQSPTQAHFGVPAHYATSPPSPGVVPTSNPPVLKIPGPQPGMHTIPGYSQMRYQPMPSAPTMGPPYVFPNGQQYPYPPQPVYSPQPPPQVMQKRFYITQGKQQQGGPVQQTSPQFASGFPPPAVQQTSPNSIMMDQPMGAMHTFQGQYVTSPPMMRYQDGPGHHHQQNIAQQGDLKKGMPPRAMMYEDYRFMNQQQPPQHHHHQQPQHSPQQPLPQQQPQQQEFVEGHPLHPGHHQPHNIQHQHQHQHHPHPHQQHHTHHAHQHQHAQAQQLPQGPQSPQQGQPPLPHHQFPHHQQGASSSPLAFPHMQRPGQNVFYPPPRHVQSLHNPHMPGEDFSFPGEGGERGERGGKVMVDMSSSYVMHPMAGSVPVKFQVPNADNLPKQ